MSVSPELLFITGNTLSHDLSFMAWVILYHLHNQLNVENFFCRQPLLTVTICDWKSSFSISWIMIYDGMFLSHLSYHLRLETFLSCRLIYAQWLGSLYVTTFLSCALPSGPRFPFSIASLLIYDVKPLSPSPESSCSKYWETALWPHQCSSILPLSRARRFATPRTAARQASPSISTSWGLRKLASIEAAMPSNHRILCRSLRIPFTSGILFLYLDYHVWWKYFFLWPWLLFVTGCCLFLSFSFR